VKIRLGFVSNSSSTSFIVIGHTISNDLINVIKVTLENSTIVIDNKGELEFGWDDARYTTFWDRLNFTMIQIMYQKQYENSEKYQMLKNVLKLTLDVDVIENKLSLEYICGKNEFHAYIDHQSSIVESENIEMFESEEKLRLFLFSEESYIQGGNDND
jgi:hypothetical protein